MKLYSYIVVHDRGFAPNPFWGYCTLATCKPRIRRKAQMGDWVIATGSKQSSAYKKLVYAMHVDEVLSFEAYDLDPRFELKKPAKSHLRDCGDNIYFKDVANRWRQRDSFHKKQHMAQDLGGNNVLVSKTFYFFGNQAVEIPQELEGIIPNGRGHKSKFGVELVIEFVDWLQKSFKTGLIGQPMMMPKLISLPSVVTSKLGCQGL